MSRYFLLLALVVCVAGADSSASSGAAADIALTTTVVHTTGGAGFHRALALHVPLHLPQFLEAMKTDTSGAHQVHVQATVRVGTTFFVDIAEAYNQWEAHFYPLLLSAASSAASPPSSSATSSSILAPSAVMCSPAGEGDRPGVCFDVFVEPPQTKRSSAPSSSSAKDDDNDAYHRGGGAKRFAVHSQYPFDIEIPVMKVPYTHNTVTIDLYLRLQQRPAGTSSTAAPSGGASSSASSSTTAAVVVVSVPFHERYEAVLDGTHSESGRCDTHVRRCIDASDIRTTVTILPAGKASSSSGPPTKVGNDNQKKNGETSTTTGARSTAFLPSTALTLPEAAAAVASQVSSTSTQLCFDVPTGCLQDLPFYYWGTMSAMVAGAVAVFAAMSL